MRELTYKYPLDPGLAGNVISLGYNDASPNRAVVERGANGL